jgi:hypothetical protein
LLGFAQLVGLNIGELRLGVRFFLAFVGLGRRLLGLLLGGLLGLLGLGGLLLLLLFLVSASATKALSSAEKKRRREHLTKEVNDEVRNRLFWCFETKAWKRELVKKYEKAMELGLPSNASTGKMIDAICKALGEADITQLQAWEKEVH